MQCQIYVWNKNKSCIKVKVQNKNDGNTLHIVYGNNHFELADTFYQIIVSFDFQNQFNMYETKNDGMTKEPINK